MLISFTVENYRSFKDPVTLRMEATHLVGRSPAIDAGAIFDAAGHRLLTSAAVFGANASGKSNLARAFLQLCSLLRRPVEDQDSPLPAEPFRLDAATVAEPTRFEIRFVAAGVEHRYGLHLRPDRVVEEWLHWRPNRRETLLFRRSEVGIELGSRFEEGRGLESRVRPNALFLSVVAAFNGERATRARGALLAYLPLVYVHQPGGVVRMMENITSWHLSKAASQPGREFVNALLREADTGILDFEIQDGPNDTDALATHLGTRIRTLHRVSPDADSVTFDLETDESAGTQRLFAFAGTLFLALEEGLVLIIDELDARLHPNLTRKIVELFHSPETNPKHAQLVCTTHDTNLLTPDLFRRDQIWFVEKGSGGQSELYSLAEIKGVREDAAWERAYLAGKFGAVPILNRFGQGLDVRGPK